MKKQSGFTLIELVVVFVILGILAATAVPRFTTVTNQSRTAVADGITGSIQSAAVIAYAANSGAASTAQNIVSEVACDTSESPVNINIAGGAADIVCDGTFGQLIGVGPCTGTTPNTVIVTVGGQAGTTRNIPAGLCSG